MEYYSVIKKNETLEMAPQAEVWVQRSRGKSRKAESVLTLTRYPHGRAS